MLNFSHLTKSYTYDRAYCHNKTNIIEQKSQINLRPILQGKHSHTLSLPKIQARFVTPIKKQGLVVKLKSKLKSKLLENPEFDEMQNERIGKSQILSKKIKQLKQMNLFDKNRLHNIKHENQSKKLSVLNDFHSHKTNGGFSRSKTGGIYYK